MAETMGDNVTSYAILSRSTLRILLAVLVALLGLAVSLSPAGAMHVVPQQTHPPLVHFSGQVTAISGPAANPTRFTLQTNDRAIDFQIVMRTNIVARSAEAQIEGLSLDDFAMVTAARPNGSWTAYRIVYDVQPWGPIRQFTVTGTVQRVDKRGRGFQLRMSGGTTHWIVVNQQSKFAVAGIPVDTPPTLIRDSVVEVLVRRAGLNWVALTVNVRQGRTGSLVR